MVALWSLSVTVFHVTLMSQPFLWGFGIWIRAQPCSLFLSLFAWLGLRPRKETEEVESGTEKKKEPNALRVAEAREDAGNTSGPRVFPRVTLLLPDSRCGVMAGSCLVSLRLPFFVVTRCGYRVTELPRLPLCFCKHSRSHQQAPAFLILCNRS